MDELVKNGGMEILVSVGPKKAVQMFNKQQAHAYEMFIELATAHTVVLCNLCNRNCVLVL